MITQREVKAIFDACKKFRDSCFYIPLAERPFIKIEDDECKFSTLNDIAKHFKLTIYYLREKCFKSVDFGRDFFIKKIDDHIRYHENIGLCLKLPAGLNKLKDPVHNFKKILKKCKIKGECNDKLNFDSDLDFLEQKYKVTFEIWTKKKKDVSKSEIECIRKCKTKFRKIQLHLDVFSGKLFLIADKKLYFRSYMKKLKIL